jgi:hypothetical protein
MVSTTNEAIELEFASSILGTKQVLNFISFSSPVKNNLVWMSSTLRHYSPPFCSKEMP